MKARIICLLFGVLLMFNLAISAKDEERFGGIGIIVAQLYDQDRPDHRGELIVLGTSADSTARKSGISPGDVIVSIDNFLTAGSDFAVAVQQHLRGSAGSTAALKIRRAGIANLLEFKITRVELKG